MSVKGMVHYLLNKKGSKKWTECFIEALDDGHTQETAKQIADDTTREYLEEVASIIFSENDYKLKKRRKYFDEMGSALSQQNK